MSLFEEGFTQNRELSWLRYDERVLDEALDESVPLFERLNYISIFVSNLEEFFQVRVGSLIGDYREGDDEVDSRSGMTPLQQLQAIHRLVPELLHKKDAIYKRIDEELSRKGLVHLVPEMLKVKEKELVETFFTKTIKPALTATLIKKKDDFPYLDENRPYIFTRLSSETDEYYGIVDIPGNLPKIYVLADGAMKGIPMRYILTEDVIKMYIGTLFDPFLPVETFTMDITRNAEVKLGEENEDQLENMKEIVEKRLSTAPDKLITDAALSSSSHDFLAKVFKLGNAQFFKTLRIDFKYVGELEDAIPYWIKDDLCFRRFTPYNQLTLGYGSMLERAQKQEILSAYPFDSMDPFLELLSEAADSDQVTEIRMTIYRLASQPTIVDHLMRAASNGKKVRVLMELRARFDEAHNIDWSEKLEQAGCKVYFGDDRYKVHSKLCQIVLKHKDGERFITQVSTGNYNEKTASKYTDFALITYDQRIGKDIDELFHNLFHGKTGEYKHILASPTTLHDGLVDLINREARKGEDGFILMKCNSLTDERIIEALMDASCAGCKIRMIVRGICCILPGVEFCTENIKIVNVVGRLLEHSRVYVFGRGKDEIMYISSADLMTRNMVKRVELACPIYGKENRERINRILQLNYRDNVKGRMLTSRGTYTMKPRIKENADGTLTELEAIDSQQILMEEAERYL